MSTTPHDSLFKAVFSRVEHAAPALRVVLLDAQRTLLLKQLARRFGDLSESAVARVQAASSADLELWADRVLTAASLTEVLGEV